MGNIVSKWVFPSSVSCSSKLVEPKERAMGTCSLQSVRSTGNILGLRLASEVEGGLVGLRLLPVESDSVSG